MISNGGPGLPPMGVFKTNWFDELHENYNNRTAISLYPIDPRPGAVDPYYTFDYLPVPISWQKDFFDPKFWDSMGLKFGNEATRMGPLTFGARRFAQDPKETQSFEDLEHPKVELGTYYEAESTTDGLGEEIYYRRLWEMGRRTRARRILCSLEIFNNRQSKLTDPENAKNNIINAKDNEDPDDEEGEGDIAPPCSRWFEITQYLINNRGLLELALDTMVFDMPEATLYRYSTNRGGLQVTPIEWRTFLRHCDYRDEIFKYGYLIDSSFMYLSTDCVS